jgi:histidine ammonia-lyase
LKNLSPSRRFNERVELAPAALERIKVCRAMLEDKLAKKRVMYGTNTGIGEFSETMLNDEQVKEFQKYLIYNHAAGIGDPAPIEHVRAAHWRGRINVHAHGNSGCRPEITLTLVEMLNKGVTPVVCQKGSVGASGDLAPMAQAALLLMGEGEAFLRRRTTSQVKKRCGGRESMSRAWINGARRSCRPSTAPTCSRPYPRCSIYDMERFLKQAEIAAAMSIEALLGNMKPYNTKLHELRGFAGAIASAKNIAKVIEGSDLATGKMKTKVQDAYSMRSTPQVIGAARDAIAYARSQVEIELNGVGDNPIFVPEDEIDVSPARTFRVPPFRFPWTWRARPSRWSVSYR